MKITIIVDKVGTAIYRLAEAVKRHNPHLNIVLRDVHPKRPSSEQLRLALQDITDSDLVDVHYWRSGEVVEPMMSNKKKILFHFNPYDLEKRTWDNYDEVVVGNEEMRSMLPKGRLIPYGVDLDFFAFNENYADSKTVLMVANRIESKKGILEVAEACRDLDYRFVLVGNVSDAEYFNQVAQCSKTGKPIEFFEDVSDEKLRELYYEAAIVVCNSKDNFESGTLPILEAMACGVPVLTRIVGHVPDLYDGDNMLINPNPKEDVEALKEKLKELMENKALRVKYRNKGFTTVKNRYDKKMARQISNLYYQVIGAPFVSIIMPTFDRPKIFLEALQAAVNQSYPYKEIVVVDSGNTKIHDLIKEARKLTPVPIKYIAFDNQGEFTLPKARNLGVMDAQGEYLLFCDERLKMDKGALFEFVKRINKKTWLYGLKDNAKKEFVENFSFVNRRELINDGGFNERIDCYGGTSEELRRRFAANGFIFEQVQTAHAFEIVKSGAKHSKKKDIIRSKFNIFKLYG